MKARPAALVQVHAADRAEWRAWLDMFSPRKARSAWSKSNKARVEKLIASGRMTEIGLARIEAAKRDGSWTALDAIENLTAPPALGRALSRNKRARKHFDALSASVRKLLIRWIVSAKRPETQERRIRATVAAAAREDVPESFKRG